MWDSQGALGPRPVKCRAGLNHKSEILRLINCVCQPLCVCMWSCQINRKQININRQFGGGQASWWGWGRLTFLRDLLGHPFSLIPLPRTPLVPLYLPCHSSRSTWNHAVGAGATPGKGKVEVWRLDIITLKITSFMSIHPGLISDVNELMSEPGLPAIFLLQPT